MRTVEDTTLYDPTDGGDRVELGHARTDDVRAAYALTHVSITTAFRGRDHSYPHFTDGKTNHSHQMLGPE